MPFPHDPVLIDYTNWSGARAWRTIRVIPGAMIFMSNSWHPEYQWLIRAIDMDDGVEKTWALANIHQWGDGPKTISADGHVNDHLSWVK